ncbi:MAG TPA: dipeptidase [Candidatus Acidoferrales bacterium]|nr:dipeptidase [Candidatus Acidoferrales bacterium]
MELTRREALKGLAIASIAAAVPVSIADEVTANPSSFSSIGEIFERTILIDDLSGFDPDPSLPDVGFSLVKESGITIVSPTLGDVVPERAFESTVNEIAKMQAKVARHADHLMIVRSFSDIEKAKREKKLGLLINVQNSACIERDLKRLDLFYDLGLRQVQLTFNWRNWVGDGCTERTQAGLSYFGVDMVQRMNELGMIVDVSHTGYQSTLDAVEVSNKPIVFSHTNCKALCDHPRNKTDDQIRALARKGGVIGLSCFNWFVSDKPRSTLDDLLDHFDHVARLVGPQSIGIGSDFSVTGWAGRQPDAEWEAHKSIYGEREWKVLKGRFPPYIDEVNNARRYRTIAEGLQKRGWKLDDIAGVLGRNLVRVYQQVLK